MSSEHQHDVVPFPAELTGYVIGQRGNGIQSLSRHSNARVWVDTNFKTHFNRKWAYLHAQGTPDQVDGARCQLMMRITDAMNARAGGNSHPRSPRQ